MNQSKIVIFIIQMKLKIDQNSPFFNEIEPFYKKTNITSMIDLINVVSSGQIFNLTVIKWLIKYDSNHSTTRVK